MYMYRTFICKYAGLSDQLCMYAAVSVWAISDLVYIPNMKFTQL